MKKIVQRRTTELSSLCIVFDREDLEIEGLGEGDIIEIKIINKEKGGQE
jgi:hypothetical protein